MKTTTFKEINQKLHRICLDMSSEYSDEFKIKIRRLDNYGNEEEIIAYNDLIDNVDLSVFFYSYHIDFKNFEKHHWVSLFASTMHVFFITRKKSCYCEESIFLERLKTGIVHEFKNIVEESRRKLTSLLYSHENNGDCLQNFNIKLRTRLGIIDYAEDRHQKSSNQSCLHTFGCLLSIISGIIEKEKLRKRKIGKPSNLFKLLLEIIEISKNENPYTFIEFQCLILVYKSLLFNSLQLCNNVFYSKERGDIVETSNIAFSVINIKDETIIDLLTLLSSFNSQIDNEYVFRVFTRNKKINNWIDIDTGLATINSGHQRRWRFSGDYEDEYDSFLLNGSGKILNKNPLIEPYHQQFSSFFYGFDGKYINPWLIGDFKKSDFYKKVVNLYLTDKYFNVFTKEIIFDYIDQSPVAYKKESPVMEFVNNYVIGRMEVAYKHNESLVSFIIANKTKEKLFLNLFMKNEDYEKVAEVINRKTFNQEEILKFLYIGLEGYGKLSPKQIHVIVKNYVNYFNQNKFVDFLYLLDKEIGEDVEIRKECRI